MANVIQKVPLIVTLGTVPEFGMQDIENLLANSYSQQSTAQKYEQPNSVGAARGVIYYGQAMTATISGAVPASLVTSSSGRYSMIVADQDAGLTDTKIIKNDMPFLACVMTNANLDTSVLNPWLVDADEPTYTAYCEGANDSLNVGQPHNRDYSMSVYPF